MMKHIYRGCGRTCNRLAGQARLALSAQQHSAPQSNRLFTHTSLTQNQASQEGSTADKYGSKLKEWWAKTTAKHVKADVDANVDVNNTEEVYGKMTPEVQDKVLNEFKEAKEDGGALSQILGGKKDPYYVPAPTYNIDGLLTVHGEELKRCNLNGSKCTGLYAQ